MTRPLPAPVRSSRLSLVRVSPDVNGAILPFVGADVAAHVRWMRLRGLSEATVQHRQKVLRLLIQHAARPLLDLTKDDLDAWQSAIGVLSIQSQATYKMHVRMYYAWAVSEAHLIDDDPAAVLVMPKVPRHYPRPISEANLQRALQSAPQLIRVWLELAAFSGLRAGEIARLERADVLDDADPPALILHGKGAKMRAVPLAPRPLRSLTEWGMPATGRLFMQSNGRPVSAKRVSDLCNDYLHRMGIAETIHKLRHRFATQALAAGLNVRQVQELLGHESIESTAIYTWVNPSAAAPTVAAIDRPLLRPVQETGT